MTSTHIRIQSEVKDRLIATAREGESMSHLLIRLMDYYNGLTTDGNSELTDRLTELEDRVTVLESVGGERATRKTRL